MDIGFPHLGPPRYTPTVVLSVLAGVCIALMVVGAIMVGKNSPDAAKRDPAAATSRQKGIVLVVIGCIGAAAFGAFGGYAGHNYAKLKDLRRRSATAYMRSEGKMTFRIPGLGTKMKQMGASAMSSIQRKFA